MKSFSILRTNVGLTTNVKIIIDSKYNLYLESIDSAPELSMSRFKKVQFSKDNYFDELVPYFFRDFPTDISFKIRNSDDSSIMYDKFENQYDDIYQAGARNIIDNKNYIEEYEIFAPIYVFKHDMPKYFIAFRIDGPGLTSLDKNNFRDEFLKQLKVVKIFDMTSNTNLGQWIDRSFRKNDHFPSTSLDVNFNDVEFTRWYGIDYNTGGFTYKSKFLGDYLQNENTLFDFEKLFFDGFKSNKIIYSQILNMSFLFDDTPSTPNSIRKWSINRYSGFYFDDMELMDKITPFITPKLNSDVQILEGNVLYSSLGDPFVLGYKDDMDMYVEYLGEFYLVVKYQETKKLSLEPLFDDAKYRKDKLKKDEYTNVVVDKYKILANIDIEGKEGLLNTKQCYIDSSNRIVNINSTSYSISNFNLSDMNIIDIDGTYHSIIEDVDGYLKLVTDYGFNFRDGYRLEYYTNYPDTTNYKFIDLSISKKNRPYSFKIYRLKFTDIKDFDTQLIDNNFSKFQYEKLNSITKTEEPKIYTTNMDNNSYPKPLNDYIFNGQVESIPTSSDYNGNFELFRLENNKLSEIWNKNSIFSRFAYQNSLSNGYYYLLNNSLVHGEFNGCADINRIDVERKYKNLDYFYTFNSGTNSYLHHSLHIEKNYSDFQDSSFRFELDKYISTYTYSTATQSSATYSYDYFSYLFDNQQSHLNNKIIFNSRKYSQFNLGDKSTPNETLFNGLKFKIFEVDSISKNDSLIENINLFSTNKFIDYKFSILCSDNLQSIDIDGNIYDTNRSGNFIQPQTDSSYLSGKLAFKTTEILDELPNDIYIGDIVDIRQSNQQNGVFDGTCSVTFVGSLYSGGYGFITDKDFISGATYSGNYRIKMNWIVVKNFDHDVEYIVNDIVIYDSILYKVVADVTLSDPLLDPSNSTSSFSIYSATTPFWNPDYTYAQGDWVFKSGEYYYRNNIDYTQSLSGFSGDFWYKNRNYNKDDISIQNGRYYKSIANNTSIRPNEKSRKEDINVNSKYWLEDSTFDSEVSESSFSSLWTVIGVWDENNPYSIDNYTVYKDILWKWTFEDYSTSDDIPGLSSYWLRVYSFLPDTDYVYTPSANPIIKISNNYYINTFGNGNTLDSGIVIYINKKWKNILVNIYVNDNTTINIDNIERDYLYSDINSRLSAANFIKQINTLDSKYDFSDYTSYVIIEEDGSISKYDFSNISEIPYFISCEGPDKFDVNINSIVHRVSTIDKNIVNPTKELVNGQIDVLSKIDYYNNIPLGYEIDRIQKNPKPIDMYRHSGAYMPVFYEIDLFDRNAESGLFGNYKFNESLSFFGIIKQRILSKVNKNGSVLKLKDNENYRSIYPMIDEFGYTYADFFMFKSTWDFEYHLETYISSDVPLSNNLFINSVIEKNNND